MEIYLYCVTKQYSSVSLWYYKMLHFKKLPKKQKYQFFNILNLNHNNFKYISDGADDQAHEDWEKNLADGIQEFQEKVLSQITT